MTPTQFCQAIEDGKPGAVYFLCGPDRFLHEECRNALIRSLSPEMRQWCFAEAEFKPGELWRELEGARQLPMLGGRTYLYITDEDDFGRAQDADTEALEEFLKQPPAFATVIFAASEPDRRRRMIQVLEKKTGLVSMEPLTRREAAAWLQRYLQKAGVGIRPELAEKMAGRFAVGEKMPRGREPGVNVLWLRTETEKLLASRPGLKQVEDSDLDLIAEFREEHEIGKLLAAIAARQLSKALAVLGELLAGKQSETLILWCVADLLRQALRTAPGPVARPAPWARSAAPYSTFEVAPQALRSYSREELIDGLRLARSADLAIKSSWKDSKLLLESLLWQLMARTSAPGSAAWLTDAEAAAGDALS